MREMNASVLNLELYLNFSIIKISAQPIMLPDDSQRAFYFTAVISYYFLPDRGEAHPHMYMSGLFLDEVRKIASDISPVHPLILQEAKSAKFGPNF